MIREILFRGKRLEDGVWVEGYYAKATDMLEDEEVHIIFNPELALFPRSEFGTFDEIDPDTLGQYTGMKDKNGMKIFEGDIVVLNKDVKQIFNVEDGEVRYGWGGFYIKDFSTLNSLNTLASYDCVLRGEVIGNIHDNPELLEV